MVTSNYRPISISPTISKVAEKWISEQIITHLNTSSFLLHPMQFGFRKHHSTETANCFLLENIKAKLDKGGVVGAIYLDLKKAFDTVNHDILIAKLTKFNFSPSVITQIKSYLAERKQCVRIGDKISQIVKNCVGVPQGSTLGPLLFSLYINDLPDVCSPLVTCQMYADDTVIYLHSKNKKGAADELSAAMANVSNWLTSSCLHLNISKSVCMFFSKSANKDPEPAVLVAGRKLLVVNEYKYLGIVIDSQLTFKTQVKKVVNRIKFNLNNFRYIRNNLTTEASKLYMHAMILSHINYCLTSWTQTSRTTLQPVERLYKQALKTLDKKSNYYHHCNILVKYGFLNWENMIKFANMLLAYKIFHGLAPPPLSEFIKQNQVTSTRASARGDCKIPYRKTSFAQLGFSYQAAHTWNSIPSELRNNTNINHFTKSIKQWLLDKQTCNHS